MTRKSLLLSVATTIEKGGTPTVPALAKEGRRDRQVNVRIGEDERLRLERLARIRGFKGSADYLRALALAGYTYAHPQVANLPPVQIPGYPPVPRFFSRFYPNYVLTHLSTSGEGTDGGTRGREAGWRMRQPCDKDSDASGRLPLAVPRSRSQTSADKWLLRDS